MKRLSPLFVLLFATTAGAQWLQVSVTINGGRFQVASDASIAVYNVWGNIDYTKYIGGTHSLYTPNRNDFKYPRGLGRVMTSLNNTPEAGHALPQGCAYATIHGQSFDSSFQVPSQSMRTGSLCWTDPDTGGSVSSGDPNGGCDANCSPILINLAGGPWRLSGADDPVLFDIDADGYANRITWTGRGEPLSFLAIDLNENGAVDDGSELFGTATLLASGDRAPNGFEVLKELDANRDGFIDASDPVWTRLLLWNDLDHDGHSQPVEIKAITQSGIAALRTDYHESGRIDADANAFRYMSVLQAENGQRPYYDVFFRSVN